MSYAFHYSPPTRFGETYRDELRRAPNIVVYLGANVVDLEMLIPPNQVRAVKVACLSGTTFRVAARVFILAIGGIENARLLLLANRVQPSELWNGHDLFGRYFMEHLYLDVAAAMQCSETEPSANSVPPDVGSNGRRLRGILGLSPTLRRREHLTNYLRA